MSRFDTFGVHYYNTYYNYDELFHRKKRLGLTVYGVGTIFDNPKSDGSLQSAVQGFLIV